MKYWGLLSFLALALEPDFIHAQPSTGAPETIARHAAGGIADGARSPTAPIVEAVVRPWMEKEQPPGVIVVVRCNGQTQFFPFGVADAATHTAVTPDTVFELASITKVFTTTSLAMEVESGNMQLDDAVAKHLPELRQSGGDIKGVTLRQLATHTSSLPRQPDGSTFPPSPARCRWPRSLNCQSPVASCQFGWAIPVIQNLKSKI